MTIDELKRDLEKYSISNDLYAIMNKTQMGSVLQ